MSTCSNNFPYTDTLFSEIKDEPAVIFLTVLSGVCFLIILCIYIEELIFIARQYNHSGKRQKVAILLTVYPVVSLMTFLALIVPRTTFIADFISSLLISLCILAFTHLIISYFGGDDGLLKTFNGKTISFQTPPCCCCCVCLPEAEFSKKVLNRIKVLVYQICFVRPCALFLIIIFWTDGRYSLDDTNNFTKPGIYLNIIGGISTLIAIYGLLVLFRRTNVFLRGRWIRLKFLALQLLIIFANIQNIILGAIGSRNVPQCAGTRDSNLRARRVNYFILSVELLILAIIARFAYRRIETEPEEIKPTTENEMDQVNHQTAGQSA